MAMKKEYVVFIAMLLCLAGGCPTASPGGESDIPCFTPTAWTGAVNDFVIKKFSRESGGLLLRVEMADGSIPPDYLFNLQDGSFSEVDREEWDKEPSEPEGCVLSNVRQSPIVVTGLFGRNLRFQGKVIPVRGGNVVRCFIPISDGFIAVISTDGQNLSAFGSGATGQKYYQVFSEIDGSALNSAQRVGLNEKPIGGCIDSNDEYLILEQRLFDPNVETVICIGELP